MPQKPSKPQGEFPRLAAQQHRERMAQRSREQFAAVSDIGELPPIADPERRTACRLDLHRFLTTYFPASTGKSPFSDDHIRAISRIQTCVLDGGAFGLAFPRGFAKTTISENSAIWAVLYGHRKFVPIFGADANAAAGNIDSIKLELSENDLLYADFPEVCHAIRALEGKPQRCASQTYQGVLTHIEWTAEQIVLPTLPDSPAGGAILTARGIMGGSRGMKHKRPDGTQQRPDFAILDDPQTDESASTELQVNKRLGIVRKNILRLGGHDRRLAVVMNATVIRPDDLVEQVFDPKKFPAWQTERIRMVKKWGEAHETLWLTDYARLRNTYDPEMLGDQQRAHRQATEFYAQNREKMDAGCEVAWGSCYDHDAELSAIQHAYNILIDDGPEVFASECQNAPIRVEIADEDFNIKADFICGKLSGHERGAVPLGVSRIVSFIDVQKDLLYWMVCGFEDGFTGYILDYGAFPEQKGRTNFTLRDARQTLGKMFKGKSLEATIYAGLDALTGRLMAREWKREDGAVLTLEKGLIDANWGESSDVIYKFCRESSHRTNLMPSHGRGIGAKGKSFMDYKLKPGERRGFHWMMPNSGKRASRYVLIDTNRWKTFMVSRMKTPIGERGCLSLFGSDPQAHRMLASHLTAEYGTLVEANGKTVVEWGMKPGRPDNHLEDCLVGCGAAASIQGVGLAETTRVRAVRKPMNPDQQRAGKTWTPKIWRPANA